MGKGDKRARMARCCPLRALTCGTGLANFNGTIVRDSAGTDIRLVALRVSKDTLTLSASNARSLAKYL